MAMMVVGTNWNSWSVATVQKQRTELLVRHGYLINVAEPVGETCPGSSKNC